MCLSPYGWLIFIAFVVYEIKLTKFLLIPYKMLNDSTLVRKM